MSTTDRTRQRRFVLELFIYTFLITLYFWFVLRVLNAPLTALFDSNLVLYAFAGLGLVILQAAGLDVLTEWLTDRLADRLWG